MRSITKVAMPRAERRENPKETITTTTTTTTPIELMSEFNKVTGR